MKKSTLSRASTLIISLLVIGVGNLTAQGLRNEGGAINITGGNVVCQGGLDNSGTVTNSGTLSLTGGLNNTGTVGGNGSYHIGGNWINSGTFVHGSGTVIFDGTGQQTIVAPYLTVFNNLTVDALSAGTTIPAGARVTVEGNTFSPGGKLTITSGEMNNNGSLIYTGTSTPSGNLTYNRTIPDDGETALWHYVSSPISPASITTTKDFYPYSEAGGVWGIAITSPYTDVESGKGYTVIGGGSISFTGSLIIEDLIKTVTSPYYTAVGDGSRADYDARWAAGRTEYGGGGFNLLGNPFTSSIRVTDTDPETVDFLSYNEDLFDPYYKAVYLYNGSSYNYIGSPVEGWDVSDPSELTQTYIQAGQGFFVLAQINNTSFTFTRSMQAHSPTATLLKSVSTEDRWPGLRLNVRYGDLNSSALLVYNSQMSIGLDRGYDVGLMSAGADIEIYTMMLKGGGAVKLARQALPEERAVENVIPVGIDFAKGGSVTFSSDIQPLGTNRFWLEDRTAGVFTDLGLKSYTVTLPASNNGIGRFFLYASANMPTGNEELTADDESGLRIWGYDRKAIIRGEVTEGTVCEIFDTGGRKLLVKRLAGGELNTVDLPEGIHGVIVIRVSDGMKVTTRRLAVL
jgi:hypothetical protein